MELLQKFSPFNLQQLEQIPLEKRVDIKYLISKNTAILLFNKLISQYSYCVLDVNNSRITQYNNVYFDTPEFQFYHDHHAGKLNRIKVRARSYSTSPTHYLEEKKRSNKNKVEKLRIPFEANQAYPFQELRGQSKYLKQFPFLEEKIKVAYQRVTIADSNFTEKATFDFHLTQSTNSQNCSYPDMVIAEIKQPHLSFKSTLIKELKELKCYPTSFSKYCSGVSLLYSEVKTNNFLPLHRFLNKNFHQKVI